MSQLIKQSHASTGVPLWKSESAISGGSFTAEYPDIWAGSPPTTTDDAINRLSMLLYARTVLNGTLSELTPQSKIIVNSDNVLLGAEAFVVKYKTSGEAEWFARLGGSVSTDIATDVDIDASGNVVACGSYATNPLVVFNADGSTFSTLPVDTIFVVKYNASGVVQWATRMGGSIRCISADASGNVLIGGTYTNNPLTIFNADGTTFGTLANSGGNDAFIVKINPTGTVQWATRISGTGFDECRGITADSTGNIYATGDYAGTITIFNSDGTTFTTQSSLGSDDSFLIKYTPAGMGIWATKMGGTGAENVNECVATPSGDVYLGGRFPGTMTLFNADGTIGGTITSRGGTDGYIAKYNSLGFFQWVVQQGGSSNDRIQDLSVDGVGNVYGAGDFAGSILISNADGSTFTTLVSLGSADAYVVKYNPSGLCLWATQLSSLGDDFTPNIAVDGDGNAIVCLRTSGSNLLSFDSDKRLFKSYTSLGGNETYLVKYNTNGFGVWTTGISGTGNEEMPGLGANSMGIVASGSYTSLPLFIRSAGL